MKDRTKISMKDSELIIKFSSSVMFKNGEAVLGKDVLPTLDSLIDIIKVTNSNYRILVEGHADDQLAGSSFTSQWAVSSARAAKVAERFEYFGFPADRIVPIGRGTSMRLVESKTKDGIDENKAQMNRRVVIRLLEPLEKKKVKFGLGVYFKDATEEVKDNKIDESSASEFDIE
jgi:flagellar motor protein MotB